MAFFDFLKKNNPAPVETQISEAPKSTDPKKSLVKRLGLAFVTSSGANAKKDFQAGEFDLEEIDTAYNVDSYIRQGIDKYVDLIFKAGFDITGRNQKSVDYIKQRLAVMSQATSSPTEQFFLEIAEDLVKYGNVFLVKARAKGNYALPPGVTATGIYTNGAPVAGYFQLPPSTIKIAREENGTIAAYQQEIQGKTAITFKPEDVIHLTWKRERGQAFGVPFLIPVLDDVKILRQVEENVVKLIYRHLFPLYLYKVGIDKPGYEATPDEIEELREEIRNMPLDGGLVIPERHDISVVGTEGMALDAEGYLKYFRKRVFTGLGVSESIMGINESSNRSTAESMSTEMHDRIKAFQKVIAEGIHYWIFGELLREGGFDPLLKPEDDVFFIFKEIDLDMQTKLDNMVGQLWMNNLITFEEARSMLGKDPVADESRLFANMITIAIKKETAEETASVGSGDKKTTEKQIPIQESVSGKVIQINEFKNILDYHWELTQADIVDMVKQYYLNGGRKFENFNTKEIEGILYLTKDSMMKEAQKYLVPNLNLGGEAAKTDSNKNVNLNYRISNKELLEGIERSIDRLLFEDLKHLITVAMRSSNKSDAIAKIIGAFQSLNYRLSFMANTELNRAYNLGYIKSAQLMGYNNLVVESAGNCDRCKAMDKQIVDITYLDTYSASVPPFHPNCTCSVKIPE